MIYLDINFLGKRYINYGNKRATAGLTSIVEFYTPEDGFDRGIHFVIKDLQGKGAESKGATRYRTEIMILSKISAHRHLCNLYPVLLSSIEEETSIVMSYTGQSLVDFCKSYRDTISEEDLRCIEFQIFFGFMMTHDVLGVNHKDGITNLNNYTISICPPHCTCYQIVYIQVSKEEFIRIGFSSRYIVHLIDFGSDEVYSPFSDSFQLCHFSITLH